jgi:hypothetical protein
MNAPSEEKRKLLGDILIEMGYISADQLAQALDVQSRPGETRRLGEILTSRGFVKRHHIDVALATQCGGTSGTAGASPSSRKR